ncbi:MAG: tRNA guanosine(34) transglycosylase Tgt [Acidimicrobiales bacterium]|nr:tRNA guanosine(34) transglycosylase Tgt [Acidimicrobiales bacterium]
MKATFDLEHKDGDARAGTVTTGRGTFSTPCFMPVGTRGAVKHLSSKDLSELGAQVILGNTYHLMLRPGADIVESLGGLGKFANWDGHTLTDSGGYQVFSLEPKISDEGAIFKSVYDGSKISLTPEGAVDTQIAIGADIQMVLDVCSALPSSDAVIREALDRTALWATRARSRFLGHPTASERLSQFGIVQGGIDLAMRAESAQRTVELDFDGYAVGGLSVGEHRTQWHEPLRAATDQLPADQPRYFMGLGDPAGIVDAVARGIDMFDCVLPTRLARHGTLLTSQGRMNLTRAEFAKSDDPIDPAYPDSPVAGWSRGYLRHLLQVKEPTAARLLTIHNLWWLLRFVDDMRTSITNGTFETFAAGVHEQWS